MAGLCYLCLLLRRTLSSPAFQISGVCLCLFLFIQWIIIHNWDDDIASQVAPLPTVRIDSPRINWSKLQYVQYVTTPEMLCSALMIWSQIEEIGSRAQRLMVYPSNWDMDEKVGKQDAPIARMLQQAQNNYFVKLRPLDALMNRQQTGVGHTWMEPYTKLLGFNLTEYDRVLAIDPASVVKKNLDELFLLPATPVAMPYIYYGQSEGWHFSTQLTLMTPSTKSFAQVSEAIKTLSPTEDDLSVLETLFRGKIIKIPQRPFALMAGEYRRESHAHYMGNRWPRKWDPDYLLGESKILHFSDHPIPKPWIKASQVLLNRNMPKCKNSEWFGASDCRDRAVWFKLYRDYADERKAVCGNDFEVAHEDDEERGKGSGRIFHPE